MDSSDSILEYIENRYEHMPRELYQNIHEKCGEELSKLFPGGSPSSDLLLICILRMKEHYFSLMPEFEEWELNAFLGQPNAPMVDRPSYTEEDFRSLFPPALKALKSAYDHMIIPASSAMGAAVFAYQHFTSYQITAAEKLLGRSLSDEEEYLVHLVSHPQALLERLIQATEDAQIKFVGQPGRRKARWTAHVVNQACLLFFVIKTEQGVTGKAKFPVKKNGGERWCGKLVEIVTDAPMGDAALEKRLAAARKNLAADEIEIKDWLHKQGVDSREWNRILTVILLIRWHLAGRIAALHSKFPIAKTFYHANI